MKTAIVLSDTHKNIQTIEKIESELLKADYVIHLGDCAKDMGFLKKKLGDKLIRIKGNCDAGSLLPKEKIIEIDGVRLLLTHGHKYRVKQTLQNLGMKTLSEKCAAALYGHTHLSSIKPFGEVLLLNPGSFYKPNTGVFSYLKLSFWKGKLMHQLIEMY